VSKGRTFPTGVGAPILLEGMQVIGRVRPSPSSTGLKHCSKSSDNGANQADEDGDDGPVGAMVPVA
jgi:hypothetical protein